MSGGSGSGSNVPPRVSRFGHWRSSGEENGSEPSDEAEHAATSSPAALAANSSNILSGQEANGQSLPLTTNTREENAHLRADRGGSTVRFTPIAWSDSESETNQYEDVEEEEEEDVVDRDNVPTIASPVEPNDKVEERYSKRNDWSGSESSLSSRPVSPNSLPTTPFPFASARAGNRLPGEGCRQPADGQSTPEGEDVAFEVDTCKSSNSSRVSSPATASSKRTFRDKIKHVFKLMKHRYKELCVLLAVSVSILTAFGSGYVLGWNLAIQDAYD